MKHFSDKLCPTQVPISPQNCRLCSCSNRQSLWTTPSEFSHKCPIFQVQKLCKTFLLIVPRLVINYLGRNFKAFVNKAALKTPEFFLCFDVTGEYKIPKIPCSTSHSWMVQGVRIQLALENPPWDPWDPLGHPPASWGSFSPKKKQRWRQEIIPAKHNHSTPSPAFPLSIGIP